VLIAVAIALVGCGASAGAPAQSAPPTSLTITYWPQGVGKGTATKWTLRCNPAGGTLPRAAAACRQLASMRDAFAPTPKDVFCTEQYGGPQAAVISGTFRGKRLWTKLQNRDGCEIARFQRHAFLVPGYSSRGPA
jgi:Subtilisin inhibitor-like